MLLEVDCKSMINKGKRDDLFAAMPPLEAQKVLMSMAVTEGIGYKRGKREQGMKLEYIDLDLEQSDIDGNNTIVSKMQALSDLRAAFMVIKRYRNTFPQVQDRLQRIM